MEISAFSRTFTGVNAEAEIRVDLALIYQGSANSRPTELELAADGRDGCHRALCRPLGWVLLLAQLRDQIQGQ
jgi:hypothetical protein